MSIAELYDSLLKARRPFEFFGKVQKEEELRKSYRNFAKLIHPDLVPDHEKYIAGEAFTILNKLYNQGLSELQKGVYNDISPLIMYKEMEPLFEITIRGTQYKFYENVFDGEVADIFKGISKDEIVYLKVATDPSDNDLLETEFEVLSNNRHQSLPYVLNIIKINDSKAILMRDAKGETVDELLKDYPHGIPAEHVLWMMERLLSVVGYLHYNCVVHGNIKPENIIINKDIHNVTLLGFSFCIPKVPMSHH